MCFIFKLIDSESALCGSPSSNTFHTIYCMKFLWEKQGNCVSDADGYKNNINNWLQKIKTKDVKNTIFHIRDNSQHFTQSNSWNNKKLYRNLCYGKQSAGKFNIAQYKPVTTYIETESPENLYHSSHLTDSIINQNPNFGGCSKLFSSDNKVWVAINLKALYIVKSIVLYPSKDESKSFFFLLTLKIHFFFIFFFSEKSHKIQI